MDASEPSCEALSRVARWTLQNFVAERPCSSYRQRAFVLDQGFTGPDGLPMVLAYLLGQGNDSLYEAEVYESELE